MKLAILIITLDYDWLRILFNFTFTFIQGIRLMISWNIIAQGGLMEVFLRNFICLKKMLQILLQSGRLGLVCMVSRVKSRFTMSSINSKLCIVRCSLLQDVLKACYKSITGASIQPANWLNSKINFAEKGKRPCSTAKNGTIASCT